MFRKVNNYEPISKSWCECCGGNVIKTFNYITDKKCNAYIIETIASGGKQCIFKVTINE